MAQSQKKFPEATARHSRYQTVRTILQEDAKGAEVFWPGLCELGELL
jgi:hypothetical protein